MTTADDKGGLAARLKAEWTENRSGKRWGYRTELIHEVIAALEAKDIELEELKAKVENCDEIASFKDFMGTKWLKQSDVLKLIAAATATSKEGE